MQFDDEIENKKADQSKSNRPFEHTVSVTIDKETGVIVGWESLYALIAAEDANKLNNQRENWNNVGGKLIKKFKHGDYTIAPIGDKADKKFELKHRDGNQVQIQVRVAKDGTVRFDGLPDEFALSLEDFTNEEKLQ